MVVEMYLRKADGGVQGPELTILAGLRAWSYIYAGLFIPPHFGSIF